MSCPSNHMSRRVALPALAACIASTACLSGFKHPLGSATQSFIDKPLLGAWVCHSTDQPKGIEITFMDFDGRQYVVRSGSRPSSACAP